MLSMKQGIQFFFFLLSIVLISTSIVQGQVNIIWTKTFGGSSSDFAYWDQTQKTSDGGYIMVATTTSFGAGSQDVWLIRTDANGETLWTKTFGGFEIDQAYSVQQTADGGYIVAGMTVSFGSSGYGAVWLIKTDAFGDTLWTKTLGRGYGNSVQQTLDGGYIIAGQRGANVYQSDILLIKTDSSGNKIWEKTYEEGLDDSGLSVRQISETEYILLGYSYVIGLDHILLIKTDAFGNKLWTKTYDGGLEDHASSFQQTEDGGYILAGSTNSFGAGSHDVWLIKTDANGDTLWTKTYGSTDIEVGNSVKQTTDGGYIIAGDTKSFGAGDYDFWLIKTDSFGDTLWTKTFGGIYEDRAFSVLETADTCIVISGNTKSFGAGGSDIWLIKTAPEITHVEQNHYSMPFNFYLYQNFPNPFNPTTKIKFKIPGQARNDNMMVTLKVYDILGNEITTLVNEEKQPGTYEIEFDGVNLSNGVYFYQLTAGSFVETKKMVLLK